MEDLNDNLSTSTTIVNECLIITLPNDIIDEEVEMGFNSILMLVEKYSVKGVILNLSMISSLDTYFFNLLERMAKTISLMGPKVVWVGLRPGVVSALIDLNIDMRKIKAACDLEQGISMILNNN
jgi:Anti-anti-sigma regulatory factor (antagonist of anti-sigma factor)